MTPNELRALAERSQAREKAIRELWDIATHIGVFPLDAMKIDADLHRDNAAALTEAAQELERLTELHRQAIDDYGVAQHARDYLRGRAEAAEQRVAELEKDAARWRAHISNPDVFIKLFEKSPCFLCGYNSHSYYQPDTHPCAARYHAAKDAAMKGTP